jgi:DNA-directed RNA polymerase subunit alpha
MITSLDRSINKKGEHCSIFVIEPLNLGTAITIGASIRRALLSEILGFALHSVRIDGVEHEYMNLSYIRESTLELLLNLKKINFKSINKNLLEVIAYIDVKGPKILTANDIKFLKNELTILNPSQYICTITENNNLNILLFIGQHQGYKIAKENLDLKALYYIENTKYPILFLDNLYNPIIRINNKISLIHDKDGLVKESLTLEIYTNGCITPLKALRIATHNLLNMFYPLIKFSY